MSCIKTELKKAFRSRYFYLALAIGMLIICINVVEISQFMAEFQERIANQWEWAQTSSAGYSLFVFALPYSPITFSSRQWTLLWPVLAAMPFGWSYSRERRSGAYNQIMTRCSRKQAYLGKFIATFVSGGLVVGGITLLSLLAAAMVTPYYEMFVLDMTVSIRNGNFLSELFYQNAWAHGLIWSGVCFFIGGTTACLCFLVGSKLRFSVMTMLVPLVLYHVSDIVITSIPQLKNIPFALSPLYWVHAASQNGSNPGWLLLGGTAILLALSFGVGYYHAVKKEFG